MELNQWQLHYPFAEQASLCFEREKKAYIAGLGRDQLEHLANPMTKSETSPSPNANESETIEKRLESGLLQPYRHDITRSDRQIGNNV